MASAVQHRARSRKRAEYLVSTKTPAEVLREHAKAEDKFDFILADELVRALSAAADNEERWALTTAGHAVLESAAV
jgi:predicted hydrolase (HD superfamily)